VDGEGRLESVTCGERKISTRRLVNAAGAWASEVAALAGAVPCPLTPFRRHLVYTGAWDTVAADWPYVWDLSRDVYFRPESSGLLLSPCDHTNAEPGVPSTSPAALDLLEDKLRGAFPALADLPVARSWAGLRIFAPDGRFVLGPDPRVAGFYWAAGLGGHGVTTSPAVGAQVAEAILSPETAERSVFSPNRFWEGA